MVLCNYFYLFLFSPNQTPFPIPHSPHRQHWNWQHFHTGNISNSNTHNSNTQTLSVPLRPGTAAITDPTMRPSGKAHCARAVASLDNRKIAFGCDRFAHCVFANSVLGCRVCSGRPCTAASPAWKPLSPPPPLDCAIRRATAWRNGLRALGRNTVRCASHLRALPVHGAWPRAAVSTPARRKPLSRLTSGVSRLAF